MNAQHFTQPLFIKPESETFYLLGVLYNTSMQAEADFPFQEVLERNKTLYLEAKAKGGCRYPVDAIPFSGQDWQDHYGQMWEQVQTWSERYDPNHLITHPWDLDRTINKLKV